MKKQYKPPKARDLYASTAQGQNTEGVCKSGTTPFFNCCMGPTLRFYCTAGTAVDDSACAVGGYHTQPTCSPGSSAATICISGQNQQ